MDIESITLDTPIVNATFLAKDIWSWITNEFDNHLNSSESHSTDLELEPKDENSLEQNQWGSFAGKDTALKLIAGMAIALEKSQGKYVRGGKLNKSEVARTAAKLINDHGEGIEVTSKALIMLIDEALKLHASKVSKERLPKLTPHFQTLFTGSKKTCKTDRFSQLSLPIKIIPTSTQLI